MTKYFIDTPDEDFVIEVPEGAQVIFNRNGGELKVVRREVILLEGDVQYNDHVLARYQDVKACRSEEVKRLDPEVA